MHSALSLTYIPGKHTRQTRMFGSEREREREIEIGRERESRRVGQRLREGQSSSVVRVSFKPPPDFLWRDGDGCQGLQPPFFLFFPSTPFILPPRLPITSFHLDSLLTTFLFPLSQQTQCIIDPQNLFDL